MRGRASWVLVAGGLMLLSSAARAQCTKDTDCKGDRVCEEGKCSAPVAPAPAAPAPVSAPKPPANTEREPEVAGRAAAMQEAPAAALAPLEPDEPATRRRSKPAMVAGIVMLSVTPIALLGALSAKNAQDKCDEQLQSDYPGHLLPESERYREDNCNGYSPAIYALGIGGVVLGVVGIPLLIYGAKNVPAGQPQASVQVTPWAGAQSGGVRLKLSL